MAAFLTIAFGIAWALQLLVGLAAPRDELAMPLVAIAGVMPSLAGWVAARRDGTALRWTAPAGWILLAFALPAALRVTAGAASGTLTVTAPFVAAALLPPIGEEVGWRGWLLPRLRSRYGELPGALIVGTMWALWHAPTVFYPGGSLAGLAWMSVRMIAVSVIMAWLARRSGDAIVVAVAFHASLNLGVLGGRSELALTLVVIAAGIAFAIALARRRDAEGRARAHPTPRR
jgi:membrane protease YdiL (CAAX protease family)